MSRYQFVFHLVISLSVMSAFARAESIRYSSSLPTTPFQAVNAGNWVTYTFDGPNLSTGILLPTNVFEMARSTGGTAIGLKGSNTSEIWNVNLANRTLQVISDSANPEISWPSGITYDPLRDHFYLSTLGGTGYIYTYNQYLNSWSALSNLNNLDSTSIAYSPYFDRIYVIAGNAGTLGNPQLLEFDPDTGILLRTRSIDIAVGGSIITWSSTQLIAVDNYLAYVSFHAGLQVIDPTTAEAWFVKTAVPEASTLVFCGIASLCSVGIVLRNRRRVRDALMASM